MSATTAPRLTSSALFSVALHGGLIAAFLLLRGSSPAPSAPVFAVKLIAAPAGPRALGAVQTEPTPAPVVEKPAPTPPKPVPVKTPAPATKAKTPPPKATTPTATPKTQTPPAKTEPQPKAGGGPTGGKGNDVANVDTPGIEFPYPQYTDNIVRRIIQQFGETNMRYTAVIRFVIRRDGSVDPASIQFVSRSGSYTFDSKAFGSIEAVANAKLFGPLPGGFREDILPVTFRFSPQLQK